MSYGQNISFGQMAELAPVPLDTLKGWVEEGLVPITPGTDKPNPVGKVIPRIPLEQVIVVRALRDGKTIEEGRRQALAALPEAPWTHAPPKKSEEDRTRERVERDRKRLFQERRHGRAS